MVLFGAVAIAAIVGVVWYTVGFGALRNWFNVALEFLRAAGPLAFFLAMAVLPAFGFPLAPFALVAGPAFGPLLGPWAVAGCAGVAIGANVALSYWLARRVFGPTVRRWIERLGYRVPELPSGTAWQVVVLLRLAPGLPFWVQSYVLGLFGVAWLPYQVVSTLVPAVYVGGVIVFGESLWRAEARNAFLGATIVGLAVAASSYWRHRVSRRER